MSLFRGSGRLEQKLAQNNDPMKQKRIFRTALALFLLLALCIPASAAGFTGKLIAITFDDGPGAYTAALGLFFLLAMGSQFTVFACVLLGCAAFVFVDGLVTKNRK